MNLHYPFTLMPLPYPYEGLSPQLDARTLYLHHDKHHNAYVQKLNQLLAPYPTLHRWPLERLIAQPSLLPQPVRRQIPWQAGGVYTHNLYWHCLAPQGRPLPPGDFSQAIARAFGSLSGLWEEVQKLAAGPIASGWVWLVCDRQGALHLAATQNQDTPPLHRVCPLMAVDLWEHAYYLDYQNRRADYLAQIFPLMDWQRIASHYRYGLQWAAIPQPQDRPPSPRR